MATWQCEYLWHSPKRWSTRLCGGHVTVWVPMTPRRWSRRLCDGHMTVWVPMTLTEALVQETLWRPRDNVSTHDIYRGASPGGFLAATWQCDYIWHLPRRWSRRLCGDWRGSSYLHVGSIRSCKGFHLSIRIEYFENHLADLGNFHPILVGITKSCPITIVIVDNQPILQMNTIINFICMSSVALRGIQRNENYKI